MLTPSFDIRQDEEFVIVTIRVPYVKATEAEFHIQDCEFKFHCKPYFLRLHLPGVVTEDGREKAVFDVDAGTMTVHLPKLNHGEYFKNLDMLTTLLSKKPNNVPKDTKPLIEVIGGGAEGDCESGDSEDDFDWQMEQQVPEEQESNLLTTISTGYGFTNQHRNVFTKLQGEIPNIIDCPDPDHMRSHERRLARLAHEEMSFDLDHYLADLMDNDSIQGLLQYEPPWRKELTEWRETKTEGSPSATVKTSKLREAGQDIVTFTQSEREQLKDFPNKEYLLDKATTRCLYLGLIDIIFAYCYDHRTTQGEGNVESGWTLCKLSPTLCWLEVYRGGVHDVVYSCLRRSLCYPLYRHWQLALAVLQDTRDIFRLGRRKLLQCLLSVHHSLTVSDPYYVLNNLYITDYCMWIQKASVRGIQSLANELDEVKVTKESVGWELDELETAAQLVLDDLPQPDSDTESEDSEDTKSCDSSEESSDTTEEEENSRESERTETDLLEQKTACAPNLISPNGDLLSAEIHCQADNTETCSEASRDMKSDSGGTDLQYVEACSNADFDVLKQEQENDMSEAQESLTLISVGSQPGVLEQLMNLNIHES